MRYKTGVMVSLVLAGLVGIVHWARSAAEEGPSIKAIMRKANGARGIFNELRRGLREEEPDWAELRDQSRELIHLAEELGKTTPPRGDKESWKGLTRAYVADARALEKTLTRMDGPAAEKAAARIAASCTACHKAHRKKDQ